MRNKTQLLENLVDFKNKLGSANPDQIIVTKPVVVPSRVSEKTKNKILFE
jgi:hypothetical protein